MTKKRLIPVLWVFIGFILGVLLTLLCWTGLEKAKESKRFQYCLHYDYSFLNPADAWAVKEFDQGTTYYFDEITFRREGEETLLFDRWSGQIRQYHKGVLFLLLVAEYSQPGPDYQQYQIRSLADCEELSCLLEEGNLAELEAAGRRVWQTEYGEIFVD